MLRFSVVASAVLGFFPGTWSAIPVMAQKGSAPVAKCQSVKGVLLARSGPGLWTAVKSGEMVEAGVPLVALFEAELRSHNQAIDVILHGDIGQHGPLPVMETAVAIRQHPKFDLDIAIQRGIVVFTNVKKTGTAQLRMHVHGEDLDITLQDPGTKLAFEIHGRHAPGLASAKADNPTTFLMFVAVKGRAILSYQDKSIALKAPPGQAVMKWDSIFRRAEVEFLDKLPEEIQRSDAEKKQFARMCASVQSFGGTKLVAQIESLLKSNEPLDRLVAVTASGAIDDLPGMLTALSDTKNADVREQAILVLRHWLGRDKGQVKRLSNALMEKRKLSQAQALSLVQLLVGFDETERTQPQTYSLLIDYLKHSHIAVRQLAHWHLVRLAPEGKKISYDPAAPEVQRQKAHESWLKLIPPGQVPAEAKTRLESKALNTIG